MKSKFIFLISNCFLFYIISGCGSSQNNPQIDIEKIQYDKLKSQNEYSELLLTLNYCIGIQNIKDLQLSSFNKDGTKNNQTLHMLFSKNKRDKFIIRYSNIGCNTCIDLFFKNKNIINQISKYYDLIVLVNFANYQDYIVWKKITEIETGIYWVNKGDLPFDDYFSEKSYCFVLNSKLTANNYFTPNNQFPEYVNKYVDNITINNLSI